MMLVVCFGDGLACSHLCAALACEGIYQWQVPAGFIGLARRCQARVGPLRVCMTMANPAKYWSGLGVAGARVGQSVGSQGMSCPAENAVGSYLFKRSAIINRWIYCRINDGILCI